MALWLEASNAHSKLRAGNFVLPEPSEPQAAIGA